jgi:alpha-glucosidase/alpha-D-xyloside xylohydrolase
VAGEHRQRWGLFIHQPYGSFDLKGAEGKFTPAAASHCRSTCFHLPESARSLSDHAGVCEGHRPPRDAGAMDVRLSAVEPHGGPEEILGVAKTFREKKLPCDALSI